MRIQLGLLCGLAFCLGCAEFGGRALDSSGRPSLARDSKPVTATTRSVNRRFARSLPFDDDRDFELARRGQLAEDNALRIMADDGGVAWDRTTYGFVAGDAPDTVNPSLWRQAKLNRIHGLFEVCDGIYQMRGVVDFMDVEAGRVRIVAPEGFIHRAVSENVLAGNVMARRAAYMFGRLLPAGEKGRVDAGLGKTTSIGHVSIIAPTDVIARTGTRLTIDGIEIVFQNTPNAEAPAERMFYFPHRKAFYVAEEANATLHNLYTLRGAQVRKGSDWAHWLDEASDLFGSEFELVFGGHHWPRWGREGGIEYLASQRDLYKYIHDQTLHLANLGLTPLEIAERLKLPDALAEEWFNRDYYGTVRHNAKATYQLYLGFFDGNPANLNPHPPVRAGRRYVELAGGADALLTHARDAYDRGDDRCSKFREGCFDIMPGVAPKS